MRWMGMGRIGLSLALVTLLGWPMLATLREAWREAGDRDSAAEEWEIARPLGLAWNTTKVVVGAEALALPLGVGLALLLVRTDLPGRRPLLGLLALTLFVPMPLHAAAWVGAFGNLGRSQVIGGAPLLVGWPGAAAVHALAALPWVILLAGVGLRTVEPSLEESALVDLPGWRVAMRITLRRAVGAIIAAALAVAVLTAGDMTVTDILVVRTYAEEAYVQFGLGKGPGTTAAVTLPPLIVLGLVIVAMARTLLDADPERLPSPSNDPRTWKLGGWRWPASALAATSVGLLVGLPLYGLIWRAGRLGGSAVSGVTPHWSFWGLVGTLKHAAAEVYGPPDFVLPSSGLWAAMGATLAVAVAWPLAWAARGTSVWRGVAAAVVALSLATPGPVAGMALVLAYRSVAEIYDTPVILAFAYALRTFPYAFLVLWPVIRKLPTSYLEAALLDGYDDAGQVAHVALPLTLRASVAAWGVAFVLSLGELPASHPVEPPGCRTLAKYLWGLLHTGVESHLAGVALVTLVPFALAGLLAWVAIRRE